MWYSVKRVANDNYLDEEIALKVAESSTNVSILGGEYHTNTWMVGDFIKEVREAQGAFSEVIRENIISQRMFGYSTAI